MRQDATLDEWRAAEGVATLERYVLAVVRKKTPFLLVGRYRDQVVSDARLGIAVGLNAYRPDMGMTVPSFCCLCGWQQVSTGVRSRLRWTRARACGQYRTSRYLDLFTDVTTLGSGENRRDAPLDWGLRTDEGPVDGLVAGEGRAEAKVWTDRLLTLLRPRHRLAVRLRYGLGGDEPMTLRQTARCLGVTTERIRQMELTALRDMRAGRRSTSLPGPKVETTVWERICD